MHAWGAIAACRGERRCRLCVVACCMAAGVLDGIPCCSKCVREGVVEVPRSRLVVPPNGLPHPSCLQTSTCMSCIRSTRSAQSRMGGCGGGQVQIDADVYAPTRRAGDRSSAHPSTSAIWKQRRISSSRAASASAITSCDGRGTDRATVRWGRTDENAGVRAALLGAAAGRRSVAASIELGCLRTEDMSAGPDFQDVNAVEIGCLHTLQSDAV